LPTTPSGPASLTATFITNLLSFTGHLPTHNAAGKQSQLLASRLAVAHSMEVALFFWLPQRTADHFSRSDPLYPREMAQQNRAGVGPRVDHAGFTVVR